MDSRPADVVTAIDDLIEAIDETCEDAESVVGSAEALRERTVAGASFGEALAEEPRPPLLQHVTVLHRRLGESLSQLRRAQAAQLRREGETVDQIARRLGVTRQRVSALLKPDG
jgi:hypothetical protein